MSDGLLPETVKDCPLCPGSGKLAILAETALAYAVLAKVSAIQGTFLVVPKDHIVDYSDLPGDWTFHEQQVLLRLEGAHPDVFDHSRTYTPSWNLTPAGGQTLPHLHHQWIPRDNEPTASVAYYNGAATLIAYGRQASVQGML